MIPLAFLFYGLVSIRLSLTRSPTRRHRRQPQRRCCPGGAARMAVPSDDGGAVDRSFLEGAHHEDCPVGLYVHIPFCRRRCRYCDFAIVPVGHRTNEQGPEAYLQMARNYTRAILSELQDVAPVGDSPVYLRSVYVGGGTPSLAPLEMLRTLARTIRSSTALRVAPDAEWTIEMDPGTFDLAKLWALHDLGFNRVSLGVQSFDDDVLALLGRTHRRSDIEGAVALLAHVFGPDVNYSIDLISGLPGLSLAQWGETLQTAVSLDPPPKHISIYDLQIEPGTVFGQWYGQGEEEDDDNDHTDRAANPEPPRRLALRPMPTDAAAAFMYRYASGYLAARGYEHYEVSSYARLRVPDTHHHNPEAGASPWRSRHNQVYWAVGGQWYAVGMGATSFVGGRLRARPRTLADYYKWVENTEAEESTSLQSDHDLLQDIVLKRLRTKEGLDLDWIRGRFGGDGAVEAILKGAALGFELGLAIREGPRLQLIDPDGLLFSNTIISNIFVEIDEWLGT